MPEDIEYVRLATALIASYVVKSRMPPRPVNCNQCSTSWTLIRFPYLGSVAPRGTLCNLSSLSKWPNLFRPKTGRIHVSQGSSIVPLSPQPGLLASVSTLFPVT